MNENSRLRRLLRCLATVSAAGATALTANAAPWDIEVCNGHNGNNTTSASGATCSTPIGVDCWEDPNHNPPRWADGTTYARAQVRVCSGVKEIRAYAFGSLSAKKNELGGTGYYAIAWALNSLGQETSQYATDGSANGSYGNWQPGSQAVLIKSTGRVYKSE